MAVGSQKEDPRLNPMGRQFPIPVLLNLCSESMGAENFEILVENSDTGDPSLLLLGWNTYFLFNSDTVNFLWRSDEEEAESIVLLIFVLWWCFNRRWTMDCEVRQKVLFRAS